MSTPLPLGQTVALPKASKTGGIIIFKSSSWNAWPPGADNTALNILNDQGDYLLHISLRPRSNTLVLNSRSASGGWGSEERESLRDFFKAPTFEIMVYDHGDRYQLLFSNETVHYYKKRLGGTNSKIAYGTNNDTSPLSQTLNVSTYDTFAEFVSSIACYCPKGPSGPRKSLAESAVAVTALSSWRCRVYYQNSKGDVFESAHDKGEWSTKSSPLFRAKVFTPLTVISWNNGNEIRIYCLSEDNFLQEWCSTNGGSWVQGYLSKSKFAVARYTSLAAVRWEGGIRLYAQDPTSNAIQEYCAGDPWIKGSTLPVADAGSSISAVGWENNGIHLRVFYQAPDLTLKEHNWDGQWYQGAFSPGSALQHSAITALGWWDGDKRMRVYWQDKDGKFVGYRWNSSVWNSTGSSFGPLPAGTQASALQWNMGNNVRLYHREKEGRIMEKCNDNGGAWFSGVSVAQTE